LEKQKSRRQVAVVLALLAFPAESELVLPNQMTSGKMQEPLTAKDGL
jgi:hypothetical protein